ncbi:MAG: N-6 DNA methylase, partial [Moraxella sp.]|nr:N-6 DNA methylase [Moraxella sp.]
MITAQTLPDLLALLNFNQHGNIWTKTFNETTLLQVDFDNKTLIYPKNLKINEKQTCNFSSNENFVVFECVHRLLEKGYQACDIELEKRWSLGHSQKSGRADICVYHNDDLLMIIECKTYGTEYNKALKILKDDGGQLFSYWQQDRSVKWLGLYASDIFGDELIYKNDIIKCSDDENLKLLSQTDESIGLYNNAHNKQKLHEIWQETYLGQLHQELFFGDETTAYHIGIKPLRKKDLQDFNPDDKIINQFEEILRHNAVSDKENAFNRLIALFICKLVDEIQKDENSEVEFQYKIGQDTFETLQDRLQRLYTEGMDRFMKEEIFYIPNEYAQDIFSRYQGGDRSHAIDELKNTIRKLKFYTNNDFAFKDVHNEALFLQNGKILVEMVQLFEKYRIVYPSKHQFLGDLFEQLLNKGFKQNEGQFFTPSPITRFIWDSLPLQNIINKSDDKHPKVIDYACGSGHFLTEAIEAINNAKPNSNNNWVRDSIFGIEKDYRLARVSQVSMFMNGAGDSNIIFGDGLDNDIGKGIQNEQFDILVANPPYSVSAFKSHLKLKNNQLSLLNLITNNGGEIEVLFCERIAQLLKSGGIGAVILPSSILSNDSTSYTGARELLLQEFFIHAIVNLGSKTFGATGTNTVILFLEKMKYPPKQINFAKDHAQSIFNKAELNNWNDNNVYQRYLNKIDVPTDIYDKFRLKTLTWDELINIDNEYIVLHRQSLLPKIGLDKTQKDLSDDEKNAIITKKFLIEFELLEKEKITFFALTDNQKTLIINAPRENAKQKEFLGYDWSNRKGAEGIQIIKAGGKLYDHDNRFAENTLAHYIRQMFERKDIAIADTYGEYAYIVNTVDMLDFGLIGFNKSIRTSIQKRIEINSKYPLIKLVDFPSEIRKGKSITAKNAISGNYKVVAGGKDFAYTHNEYNRDENTITISASGANAGFVNFWKEKIFASDCTTIRGKTELATKYIFVYLQSMQQALFDLARGSAQPHVYPDDIKNFKIPLPPPSIQQQIIDECQKIDDEYENSRMAIETYRQKIADIFNELEIVYKTQGGGGNYVYFVIHLSILYRPILE